MIEVAKRVRFTTIIPANNAEDFLGRAIDSVLNQTFRNFVIIVIDDKSEDGTWYVARKYQQKCFPEIEMTIFQNCRGVSEARNMGCGWTGGEYILFLDADDTFEPTALEILDECIRKNNTPEILFSGYNRVSDEQKSQSRRSRTNCFNWSLLNSNLNGEHYFSPQKKIINGLIP